jgi:hypothetical protein
LRTIEPGNMTLGLSVNRAGAKPLVQKEVWKDIAELNQSLHESNVSITCHY